MNEPRVNETVNTPLSESGGESGLNAGEYRDEPAAEPQGSNYESDPCIESDT